MTLSHGRPPDQRSLLEELCDLEPEGLRARLVEVLEAGPAALAAMRAGLRESGTALALQRDFGEAVSVAALLPALAERLRAFLEAEAAQAWAALGSDLLLGTRLEDGRLVEQLRPREQGLAGQAALLGESFVIADARVDPRFDPALDGPAHLHVTSALVVPLVDPAGGLQGVFEAWNRPGGFVRADAARLAWLAAEAAALLEKTRLLEELLRHSGYNESILDGLGHAVLAVDTEGRVAQANRVVRRLFRCEDLVGRPAGEYFTGPNAWLAEVALSVALGGPARSVASGELQLSTGGPPPPGRPERRRRQASVKVTASPLSAAGGRLLGSLVVIEDVTREQRLRGTLERYMSQDVAERLLEEGESALGGRTLTATVLFSDIRDFTTLSERLGPQDTVRLLNDCFTLLVDVVLAHHGTLDKYLGDGLMAVFGAPFSSGDDAGDALRAAVDMLRALREFNQRRAQAGQPRVQMGLGLHTGQVVSGSIGSPRRMDYTVVGDGVNLASRLEGANREYGTQLLISEFTLTDLRRSCLLREVDRLRVRGRQAPVAVFEVLDHFPEELQATLRYVVSLYNEGLERYRLRDWGAALKMFDEALHVRPDDGPAQLYRQRCAHFLKAPPPPDWDGVWLLTSK